MWTSTRTVIFVTFFEVETFSRDALRKAFVEILAALAQRNQLVAIPNGDKMDSLPFASFAGIPHVVMRFKNGSESCELHSSVIVSLDSVASLNGFIKRSILPEIFSMSLTSRKGLSMII